MEEKQVKFSLGRLSQIVAATFGQPGKRTFRLELHSGPAYCSLWLEKEQLFQLGVYLRDYIAEMSAEEREKDSAPTEPSWPGGETSIDFKAGQMFLSHDKETNSFFMQPRAAKREESEEPAREELGNRSFWTDLTQATEVAEGSMRICASRRPIASWRTAYKPGRPCVPEGQRHTILEAG